jgi:hypothetical protein
MKARKERKKKKKKWIPLTTLADNLLLKFQTPFQQETSATLIPKGLPQHTKSLFSYTTCRKMASSMAAGLQLEL